MTDNPAAAQPILFCDQRCLLDDGHVERGEGHQYGYRMPSDTETLKVVIAENKILRTQLTAAEARIAAVRELRFDLEQRQDEERAIRNKLGTEMSHQRSLSEGISFGTSIALVRLRALLSPIVTSEGVDS